jgi:guanylate kinase
LNDRVPVMVVVSGPSGAGKSTLLRRVLSQLDHLRFSVSHTTRAARDGEAEGVDYHFIGRPEFERLVAEGAFLEWAQVHGELYGTSRAEYERAERDGVDLLLDVDVQGAAQVRKRFPEAVTVFVLPPSYLDLERRLRGRGPGDEESFRRRLETARAEMGLYPDYDYVILNKELGRGAEDLKAVIRAARCRTRRMDAVARKILDTFRPDERK